MVTEKARNEWRKEDEGSGRMETVLEGERERERGRECVSDSEGWSGMCKEVEEGKVRVAACADDLALRKG